MRVDVPRPVELEAFYDLHAEDSSQFGAWEAVPKGRNFFAGVPFDVNGMIRLFGVIPPPHGTIYRLEVTGIPVGRKFEQLHLLHGTGWSTEDGEKIAELVLRYVDGETALVPFVYGVHVRDWWRRDPSASNAVASPGSGMAWETTEFDPELRLYRSSFGNPYPEKEVAEIDLRSSRSEVTPAILAMTTGPAIPGIVAEEVDVSEEVSVEWREIRVRVVDAESGNPVPEAGLQAGFCDDGGCPFLGTFGLDANGGAEIGYPAEDLRTLTITAYAEGYGAESVTFDAKDVPEEFTFRLE